MATMLSGVLIFLENVWLVMFGVMFLRERKNIELMSLSATRKARSGSRLGLRGVV